jgi:hypothetical protein
MKLSQLIPFATVGLLALAACGGPEGKYTLDKEATKAAIDAGKGEKDAKEFGKAMLEAMDMSIELKSDGKYESKSSVELIKDKKKEETESGEWTKDGDKITLKGKKDPLSCKLESSKLVCSNKEGEPALVFKKT